MPKNNNSAHAVSDAHRTRAGRSVLSKNDAPVDQERIARAVREILFAVGEDPDREGLRETPHRVARMYAEMLSGLHKDAREPLYHKATPKL